MAFRRTANAIISKSNIGFDEWMEELRQQHEGAVSKDQVVRVAKNVLQKCDPNQYLLSHSTIVASVDTYAPEGSKTGKRLDRGVQIDVRYPDFRIKPECQNIINNNGDAWSRSLLLATYRTFIGSPNYLEHIQIPELSKGFIVDAIARDLGNTCYIDILVATDRKHKLLVQDILSEEIKAMSMGCGIPGTRVLMADGTVLPIEDIRPDMEVISQKGNICRVDNLQIRENRWKICRIKPIGLSALSFTDNHKFYAVPRSELQFTERKGLQRIIPIAYSFEYREAGDLLPGDVIATPILQGESKPHCSESEARLLGLWIGDGWKFDNKHNSTIGVGFCLDSSQQYSEISGFVESEINRISWLAKEMRLAVGGSAPEMVHRHIRRNADYILSTSRAVRDFIDNHSMGRKALDKCVTQDVMLWPKSHQLAFLSGIIDSNGCISISKRGTKQIFISTRNENLANQYMTILNRCGLIGTLTKVQRSGTKMLPNAAEVDYQIRIRSSGVSKIPSVKIKNSGGSFKEQNSGSRDRWIAGNHVYTRIHSIDTYDYQGFVYDLQVDNDHSYIADGIGISNCISLFTVCSHCGNVAVDETQLCNHVLYDGKNTMFRDENGIEHKLAELIGHVSVPNSNQFIEASWVRNPAFTGATRRNILNPDSTATVAALEKAATIYEIRKNDLHIDGLRKVAADEQNSDSDSDSNSDSELDDLDSSPDEPSNPEESTTESPAPDVGQSSIEDMINKAQEMLVEALLKKLSDKLVPDPADVPAAIPSTSDSGLAGGDLNNTLLSSTEFIGSVNQIFKDHPQLAKWASATRKLIEHGQTSTLSSRDLIVLSWINDTVQSKARPAIYYKTAMQLGSASNYPSGTSFLAACRLRIGHALSTDEKIFFSNLGNISTMSNKF
jgi:hypothetical protein